MYVICFFIRSRTSQRFSRISLGAPTAFVKKKTQSRNKRRDVQWCARAFAFGVRERGLGLGLGLGLGIRVRVVFTEIESNLVMAMREGRAMD